MKKIPPSAFILDTPQGYETSKAESSKARKRENKRLEKLAKLRAEVLKERRKR